MSKHLVLILAGTFLLGGNLLAQPEPALSSQHTPALAKARYKGTYYPICDAYDLSPKVKVDGKVVDSDNSPRVRIAPGTEFGNGLVKFEEAKLTHWTEQQMSTDGSFAGDKLPLSLSFSGKLTSDTTLKDCFLVIVFYRPSTIENPGTAAPFYLAGVKEIGTLKAGKTRRVTADYDVSLLNSFARSDFAWFAIVQSGEKQIRSTGGPNAVDALFEALIAWQRTKNGF